MNALDPINLSIEFVKQTVDPGGGGEFVNAQTGDIAIWAILAILFVGVIAYCMFRFSRVFNGEYVTAAASPKHAKNVHKGTRLATTKAVLIAAIVGLIACLSMTATSAIAASNKINANNVDIQPDKIQVTVDEAAGTINDATFNFVNNSQNYYLFDSTTKMELTSEVQGLTVAEDWDLQLTTLNTDLYKGIPNGGEYRVPADVVTLYPGQSAQATLKFNKGSADLAKTLIGKQVFSLTMIPDQYVVGVPVPQAGLTYDGTEQTAIAPTDAYTVIDGSKKSAGNYQATVTLNTDYKWPDKTSDTKLIDWSISPRIIVLDWVFPVSMEYNGEVQHPGADIDNLISGDEAYIDDYMFLESDDGKSACDHTVFVKSLNGSDKKNYTLDGSYKKSCDYTIAKKEMTITADNKEKAVEDPDPDLTASVDGNVPGEDFVKDTDYELSCQDHPDPEVGQEYAIYVKVKGSSTLAKNYQITTTNGKLVIVDKKPTITPDSITITYGDTYPELTATTKNLDEGFNLVKDTDFTLSRVTGDDSGEYKISVTLIETSTSVLHYGKDNIRLKEGLFTINQYSVPVNWYDPYMPTDHTYSGHEIYPWATLTKAKEDDAVSVKTCSPYDENYDCTSAGDQKCKVSELEGTSARNYSLDHESNCHEYTILQANIKMRVSMSGGDVTKPKNYEDTELAGSYELGTLAPDPSTITTSFQWWQADDRLGNFYPIEGATSEKYKVGMNDYLGVKFFKIEVTLSTTNPNFLTTSGFYLLYQYVSLVYTKMTFNDLQTNSITELYTHYGTDELYESETGTTKQDIPTATKEGFVFNGWYNAASEGTQVIDYKNSILKTAVEGYISSNGTWANTEEKTLYAGLYQINYLTFTNEAEGPNDIIFKQNVQAGCDMNPILIRYSTNLEDWGILETDLSISPKLATLENKGDKLYIAGYNPNGFSGEKRTDSFSSTGKFSVSGSLGALIDFTNPSLSAVPNDLCFQSLFADCANLTACPKVDLSFTDETSGCYNHMFKNCTSLKKIQVNFTSWPENGFDGWVEGLNTDGTCEFDCPAELKWKYDGNNFCPKEWHNSKGEAFWTVKNGHELYFFVGTEETPATSKRVLLDNDNGYSPYSEVAGNITNVTFTNNFLNWTDNLRSLNSWFLDMINLKMLDLSSFYTNNVSSFYSMFERCSSLTSLTLGDNFNTSSATNMEYMFYGCIGLESLVFGESFDTTNTTSMGYMFHMCSGLTSLKFGKNFNTSHVTNMTSMFRACSSLTTITFDENFDTANVSIMSNMFRECNSLTMIRFSEKFDVANVKEFGHMFSGCSSLANIYCANITNWNDKEKQNVNSEHMFKNCAKLPGYDIDNYNDLRNAHDFSLDDPTTTDPRAKGYFEFVEKAYAIYDEPTNSLSFKVLSEMSPDDIASTTKIEVPIAYYSKEGKSPFDAYKNVNSIFCGQKFEDWTVHIHSFNSWFSGFSNVKTIPLQNWNTINATDMSSMFSGCQSLGLEVFSLGEHFDTSNVMSMNSMFKNCITLGYKDFALGTKFNTENVTDMNSMFYRCENLGDRYTFNLGGKFSTSNVTDMGSMFRSCAGLRAIDLSGFNVGNVKKFDLMFDNCMSLDHIYCNANTNWLDQAKKHESSTDMFSRCDKLPGYKSSNNNNIDNAHDVALDTDKTPPEKIGYFEKVQKAYAVYNGSDTLTFKVESELTDEDVDKVEVPVDYYSGESKSPFVQYKEVLYIVSSNDFNYWTIHVHSFNSWFAGFSKIETIQLQNWVTSNVTDMSSMFKGCTHLDRNYRFSFGDNFDTSNVTDMSSMFEDCTCLGLQEFSLSKNFTTSKVTNMHRMFDFCSQLTSLDISAFDVSNVECFKEMFGDCHLLTYLYCKNGTDWLAEAPNSSDSSLMFARCFYLTRGEGQKYDDLRNAHDSSILSENSGYFEALPSPDNKENINFDLQCNNKDIELKIQDPEPKSPDLESDEPEPVIPDPKKEEDKEAIDPTKPEEIYIEEVIE